MQSEEQQIITLIEKMRTEEVNQAEELLMSMVDSKHFMDKIFNIIQNNNLEAWIKTIASTFLNKVISEKLEEYGYQTMFKAIESIMGSYNVAPSDKRCFERSLISLIEYIKEPYEFQAWKQFILKHIGDERLFDTGLLLIACSAVAQIQDDYLCMIVEQTFELTVSSLKIRIQTANNINELIKTWIVVFDKLKSICELNQGDKTVQNSAKGEMVRIAHSTNLAKLLFEVFEFSSPGQIWLCINPDLYELNMLKNQAAQLIRRVAEFCISQKMKQQNCPCLQLILQSYTTIKNTLAVVGSTTQVIQNYQCEDFVTSLLGLLIIYVKAVTEHPVDQMNILIHIVCFPFLKTRDEELVIFEESPIEFNSLVEDLCDKQTFGILKTEAAKLLETISDECKEVMERTLMFCVECLKMRIGYIPMPETSDIRILDFETAWQVICIYSFSLENYPTQVEAIKVILCDKRLMQLSPLDMSKVFLFLAYNYGQIFKNPLEGGFWIDYALTYKKHPTTRYQALDFISNITDEYFTEGFFNQVIKLIVDDNSGESGQAWSIIGKMFDYQKQSITEQMCLSLVNLIFMRIELEIVKLQKKKKQSTIDIVNAIQILRKILQQKDYISEKHELKQRIFDITRFFQKATELDMDDEILKILTQYIHLNSQIVREEFYVQLIPKILEQFKRDDYHDKVYFIFLNQLIVKSKFVNIRPVIKCLLTGLMFHLFDMSEAAKKSKMKLAMANLLTIIQNLLSVHGYQMSFGSDDCLCEIGAMCIRLFPSTETQKIFSKVLLAKALNVMFLCHLYSRAQNTVEYLIRFSKLNIFHKYDAFVLIKLLSKAVFAQDNVNIVIEYLNLMIEVAEQEENNKRKGVSTKTAKGRYKIKRQEEYNNILLKITSPFITNFQYTKSMTDFPVKEELVECIQKMRSNNLETYKLIIMNMTEEQRAKLTFLVNEKTEVEGKTRVIRKIVGIKSKQSPVQNITEKNRNPDSDADEEVEEESNFKRRRVLRKKNQNKKRKNQKISAEQ